VWVGRKLYARYEHANKHKRNLAIAGGVTASVSTNNEFLNL
jgi:E3 ubiquitin-protein ligase RNF19A